MAKVRPGGLMGQLSGKVGNVVFSHNRFGSYVRALVKPTQSQSDPSLIQRGVFATISQGWRLQTDADKLAWKEWAQNNQITDRVGQKQALDGHAAYCMLNQRLFAAGQSLLTVPPLVGAPYNPGAIFMYDIGAGNMQLTPVEALQSGEIWVLFGAVVSSSGINYAKNRVRLFARLTTTGTTPVSFQTELQARFGTLTADQKVLLQYAVFDTATGLYSGFLADSGIITDTP